MFRDGASIELAVETIAKTLPICKVREVAYATFSILQIAHNGEAYLVEFDNPSCIFIRDKKIVDYPYKERIIEGKIIREYRFQVKLNDCFVLMSDGVIYAGEGELMNLSWTWNEMAEYTLKCTKDTLSASRLTALLSDLCNELYAHRPGDDTTIAVMRVTNRKIVNIFTGICRQKAKMMMSVWCGNLCQKRDQRFVSGGTSANIMARVLQKNIVTSVNYQDSSVPPTAAIEGLDLVTEGVLTLGKVLKLLKKYERDDFDVEFFDELDADNGASRLARLLIEECTDIDLFVGTATNKAHQNSNLPFDLSIRMNLVEQLQEVARKMGKQVCVKYSSWRKYVNTCNYDAWSCYRYETEFEENIEGKWSASDCFNRDFDFYYGSLAWKQRKLF